MANGITSPPPPPHITTSVTHQSPPVAYVDTANNATTAASSASSASSSSSFGVITASANFTTPNISNNNIGGNEEVKTTTYLKQALRFILSNSTMDKIINKELKKTPIPAVLIRRRMKAENFGIHLHKRIALERAKMAERDAQIAIFLKAFGFINDAETLSTSSRASLEVAKTAATNAKELLAESILASLGISETSTVKNDVCESLENATIATLGQTIILLQEKARWVKATTHHKERFTLLAESMCVVEKISKSLIAASEMVRNLDTLFVNESGNTVTSSLPMETNNITVSEPTNNNNTINYSTQLYNAPNPNYNNNFIPNFSNYFDNNNSSSINILLENVSVNSNSVVNNYIADIISRNIGYFNYIVSFASVPNTTNTDTTNTTSPGFTETQIEKIPLVNSDDIQQLINGSVECVICKEEYTPQEKVGELSCHHIFHMKCIAEWLKRTKTCPVCRIVQKL